MPYPKPYRPFPGQQVDFWVIDPDGHDRLYFARQSLGMLEGLLDERGRETIGCSSEELSAFLSLVLRELDAVMTNQQHLPDFLENRLPQENIQ